MDFENSRKYFRTQAIFGTETKTWMYHEDALCAIDYDDICFHTVW